MNLAIEGLRRLLFRARGELLASLLLAIVPSAALGQQVVGGASSGTGSTVPSAVAPIVVPSKILSDPVQSTAASTMRALQVAVPRGRRMKAPPAEALEAKPAVGGSSKNPQVVVGGRGTQADPIPRFFATPLSRGTAAGNGTDGMAPQNYGQGNAGTIYHYGDSLVTGLFWKNSPHRSTGWFVFVAANGLSYRCTASLISKSILVTAGHCVHDGGNGAAGWIKSGTFYAAYQNGWHLGQAKVNTVYTTTGWFNTGALDEGYDIGVVVLEKRSDVSPPEELGTSVGWNGFCYLDCLQNFKHVSQLGYPANYYDGLYQTRSEHLSASDTRDYVYGSGMEEGSSGGPHISNFGFLKDVSFDSGQDPSRNIVVGVTSWGFEDPSLKIQGGSSLSGPNNSNRFRVIFNTACRRAQALHGMDTCTLLQ